ncbi:MAG: histidinol-phosphate transaminase [Bdellovibrionales bacterium]|nr:histidinol-phosphate transaminase [Bdellovibrionales bacterium]
MEPSIHIRNLIPYKPGKPIEETQREYGLEEVYKLASNENPLGPSERVIKAICEAAGSVHLYPDASFYEAKKSLSRYYGVEEKFITLGNGSNELIDLLIRVYCEAGDRILTSQGAFIAYKICAQAARVETVEAPLTEDLKFDVKALLKELEVDSKIKILFIANPNNPTGTFLNREELNLLMDKVGHREDLLIVLDEAYCEFVRDKECPSGLEYFRKFSNVIVLRTLSKVFGLAGLRVGVLIGPEKTVDYVNRVRNPFNVNQLALKVIEAAVSDSDYIERSQNLVWNALDTFYAEFDELGIKYWKSQGNFVLFDLGRPSGPVFEALLKRGVITRPVAAYGFPNALRLSVGLPKENEIAIHAIKEVLKG